MTAAAGPAASGTAALLQGVWTRNLPVLEDRLRLLDRAAAAAAAGLLEGDVRVEAHVVAHKLSGSLGMFGYPAGSDAARGIEEILDPEAELVDAGRLSGLVANLRLVLAIAE